MAANTALINAAFKLGATEAAANVPNLKPLYDSTASIARKGFEIVTGAIDELKLEQDILEAGKKRQTEALQKDANGVYKSIYELEETLPNKVVMAIKKEVKRLQKEFELVNTYGEGDTEENNDARIRINAQLSKIKNEALNLRKNMMLMTQDVKGDGGWDVANINPDNIDPLRSILKGELRDMDDNDDIFITFDKDGKLTFNTKNYSTGTRRIRGPKDSILGFINEEYKHGNLRSFNSDQMMKMIPRKNAGYMTDSIEQLKTISALGGSDATAGTYNYNDQMAINQTNGYTSRIADDVEFQNASREQRSGQVVIPALKESLMGRVDIPLDVMNNIFVDDRTGEVIPVGEQLFAILNQNDDTVLDEKDYEAGLKGKNKEAFKAAYKELIDVYTNIHNPSFDLDNSLALLGQHNEAYSKQHYDQAFEANGGKIPGKYYPEDDKDSFKFNVNQGYTMAMGDGTDKYVSGQLVVTMQNFINNPKEGAVQKAYDGNIYSYKDGKFYMGESVVTPSQISKNLGMWQYGYNPKDTYSALPSPDELEEAKGVPFPSEEIIFKNISKDTQTKFYIKKLEETYKDYPDFKFERTSGGSVLITAPDGTEKSISTIGRFNFGREKEARNEIQAFIAKHASPKQ